MLFDGIVGVRRLDIMLRCFCKMLFYNDFDFGVSGFCFYERNRMLKFISHCLPSIMEYVHYFWGLIIIDVPLARGGLG
jgi:hypothetical protein